MAEKVSAWSKWFLLLVEEKKVDTANLLAAQWDPVGGSGTFDTVRLSVDGQEPAEYVACSTPATETMRDGITTALGVLAWAEMYWTDNVLADDNAEWTGPDGWTHTGDLWSAWVSARADLGGLVVIQSGET